MSSRSLDLLKHTPLYEWYKQKEVKLIDFGGWEMPVQFSSIKKEHEAVRKSAGLFEVSHMGEIIIEGEKAESWLNGLVTNDLTRMKLHQAQYNAVCKEDGGTLDDLIILKLSQEKFFITPNASNTEKIYDWLLQHASEGVSIQNQSEAYGLLALQGPDAEKILQEVTEASLSEIKPFYCKPDLHLKNGIQVLVSRTGYTGEDGFEIYCAWEDTAGLWSLLLETGEPYGLLPCGLGARDTLRLEKGLALYGQELSEEITPLEGGIGFAVKTKAKRAHYVGKDALIEQREEGLPRIVCGVEMKEKGIPRTGYLVYNDEGDEIGTVTSGTKSPTTGRLIGMAIIDKAFSKLGTEVQIQIRNKRLKAEITDKKFV